MAFNFLKERWQRVALVVLLSLILFVFALAFVVNQYWSPILSDRIKKVVATSSDGLYKIDFSDSKLYVLQGKVVIYNLVLKVDTAVYHRRQKEHLAPNNLVELHIKRLVLKHIHPFSLYFRHKLNIGEIVFSQPELNITYQLNHTKDTTAKDNRTLYQRISKSLKSVYIKNIMFNDVKFKYEDYSGNKVAISELKEMNLEAQEFLVDSATQADKARLLYCKDIIAELNNYSGKTPSGLYSFKLKSARLSTLESKLEIKGLDLQPVKPDVFFNKSVKDRFTLHLDSVQLNRFDFLSYHKYRIFDANNISISGGNFNVFGNPHSTVSKTDRIVSFPHVALRQLKEEITVDTLDIQHINLTYTEYNTKSKQTGYISFDRTAGRFFNITNNKDSLAKNNLCTARVSSHFMNRGLMNVVFTFNLTDAAHSYSYRGHLEPMDLRPVNSATMTLALLKITSGELKSFDFDFKADRKVSKGRVTLLYNNLKVNLLKADTVNDQLKKKTIASLFANIMIIKHDNPDNEGKAPRSFYVVYDRPVNSPFFKTVWTTFLKGIKPCVGVDEKTEQAVKTKMSDAEAKKQERKIKKEERKQRRADRKAKRELKKQQKEDEKKVQ